MGEGGRPLPLTVTHRRPWGNCVRERCSTSATGHPSRPTSSCPSSAPPSGGAWPGRELAADTVAVSLGFDWLERLDIVVRDLERGLVDFPAVIDGREVYLCWLLDEPSVGHWHGIETGFAGRRPLTD